MYKCSTGLNQGVSSKGGIGGKKGIKNIFVNSERPLLEIYTHENKNIRRGIIPSGDKLWDDGRRMDGCRGVEVKFTTADDVKEPQS